MDERHRGSGDREIHDLPAPTPIRTSRSGYGAVQILAGNAAAGSQSTNEPTSNHPETSSRVTSARASQLA